MTIGYSGSGVHKNKPASQSLKGLGPIPQGRWRIGAPYRSQSVGPYALRLTPDTSTKTFGRTALLIHGDSIKAPGTASNGCIILPRSVRERIWTSGDRDLLVAA